MAERNTPRGTLTTSTMALLVYVALKLPIRQASEKFSAVNESGHDNGPLAMKSDSGRTAVTTRSASGEIHSSATSVRRMVRLRPPFRFAVGVPGDGSVEAIVASGNAAVGTTDAE